MTHDPVSNFDGLSRRAYKERKQTYKGSSLIPKICRFSDGGKQETKNNSILVSVQKMKSRIVLIAMESSLPNAVAPV